MAIPGDTRRKFTTEDAARAVHVPADPRATGYEGSAGPAEDTATVDVKVDGYSVSIRAAPASVREVVGMAYLIGGFELVAELDRAVRSRVNIESLTLTQLQTAVQHLSERVRTAQRHKDAYDRALNEQLAQIPGARRRVQAASDVLRLLHEEWARIAAAEEQVLREYEPLLISQFVQLTTDARTLALREWARYEPYDGTTADVHPLTTADAKKRSASDLRLRKEAGKLVEAVRNLHLSWKDYLDALGGTRKLVDLGVRRIRLATPGADAEQMIANSRAYNAAKFRAFETHRSDIGARFPAALQVYGRIGTVSTSDRATSDAMIERWVIEALIEAVDSSYELANQAVTHPLFAPGTRMRVEAGDGRAGDLPWYQEDLFESGLTIPASRIIANQLADVDDAVSSPWFQLPVRLALFKRGTEGEEDLAPYATPGRLHHAALSEVNNALQEVRRKRKEQIDQALLVINALAVPSGFFTGGATVAIAGVIHAIVRGNEMYLSVRKYQALDALAQIALVPMQQAIWEHPSAVALAGKLLEGGFEIATDLVNGGLAGAVMDAIQVSLAIGYGVQEVAAWAAADDPLGDAS